MLGPAMLVYLSSATSVFLNVHSTSGVRKRLQTAGDRLFRVHCLSWTEQVHSVRVHAKIILVRVCAVMHNLMNQLLQMLGWCERTVSHSA